MSSFQPGIAVNQQTRCDGGDYHNRLGACTWTVPWGVGLGWHWVGDIYHHRFPRIVEVDGDGSRKKD